jgi:hypothetical protein
MKLKEIIEEEKKIMSPLRRKMNTIILPLYLSINLPPILIVIPLMIVDAGRYFPIFIAYMVVMALTTVGILATIPWMNKKETEIELERFDYLFHSAKPVEGEKVQVVDEDVVYTLSKEGIHIKLPLQMEKVFEEANEDSFFFDWREVELALATQSHLRRVHLALAVFDRSMEVPPFFIPMSEELFSAIQAFDLQDKIGVEWLYVQYNPKDAFKQILTRGRILKMRNRKTGKVLTEKQLDCMGEE